MGDGLSEAYTYHGRQCKHCSGTLRYASGKKCVECTKSLSKAVYRFDPVTHTKATRAWREANVDLHNELMRAGQLKRKFGITIADYDALLASQGDGCAICKSPCPTGRRLAVDHDHATKAVRGLLCHSCNLGIGKLGDDPERLLAAAKYLLGHLDKNTSTSINTAAATQNVATTYSVKLLS